jgi:hypothetical protein
MPRETTKANDLIVSPRRAFYLGRTNKEKVPPTSDATQKRLAIPPPREIDGAALQQYLPLAQGNAALQIAQSLLLTPQMPPI